MKKDAIRMCFMIIVSALISSLVSVAATGHLFDSSEVVYDNSQTNLESTNVKDAVDELYAAATEYSNINSRVATLESYFQNNPTTKVGGNGINVGRLNNESNASSYINFYRQGVVRGTITAQANGDMQIYSRNSSETPATGSISLQGDTVSIGKSGGTVNLNGGIYSNSVPVATTKKTGWGKSLSFTMNSYAQHAIVCISQNHVYLFWLAGDANNPILNVTRIYGTQDPNGFATSVNGKTITVSLDYNATITAFIGA